MSGRKILRPDEGRSSSHTPNHKIITIIIMKKTSLLILMLGLNGCLTLKAPEIDMKAMKDMVEDMSNKVELSHERKVIATKNAPQAVGPYSQAIKVGSTIYCAGQIGLDPTTGQLVSGGIEAETKRVMENIKAVLTEGGFQLKDVVQATVFLTDLSEFQTFNTTYGTFFSTDPPARATVQVAALPRNARVQIAVTAVK